MNVWTALVFLVDFYLISFDRKTITFNFSFLKATAWVKLFDCNKITQWNNTNNNNSNNTYCDKTCCHYITRTVEHMGISNLTGKRLKSVKKSAVFDHLLERNYSIGFNHFDILASDSTKFILFLRKVYWSKETSPS